MEGPSEDLSGRDGDLSTSYEGSESIQPEQQQQASPAQSQHLETSVNENNDNNDNDDTRGSTPEPAEKTPPPDSNDGDHENVVNSFEDGAQGSLDDNVNDDDNEDDELHDLPNRTILEEREMHRRLMDMESSFLPEPSTIELGLRDMGADDTYLMGAEPRAEDNSAAQESYMEEDLYKTPVPNRVTDVEDSTAALETMSSPPTTAAAGRTVSRVLSDTAFRDRYRETSPGAVGDLATDADATPRRSRSLHRGASLYGRGQSSDTEATLSTPLDQRRQRPKFLASRQSAHRLSASSINTATTDATSSDATMGMGVDYALQSGGAAPDNNLLRPHGQSRRELSRSISLGSLASGMSTTSDDAFVDNRRAFSGVSEASLHTLDEEEVASGSHSVRTEKKNAEEHGDDDLPPPMTPKAQAGDSMVPPPTDTVTAHRFLDMQFPATVVRPSFRDNSLSLSPGKRDTPSVSGHGFSRGKHMTLKEQSSTIDRLSKENFDLKMRIHFLNEALSKRSEEGIQEMVSENVELKSDKLKLQKDNQALRKTIRELQKQLRDRGKAEDESEDGERGSEGRRTTIEEEELTYLRERVETYEVEIERLRSESIARESEKRKLAEMVKTLGDGRANVGSDAGAREERDMWKDMLDAETAAREQAEEESRNLREELHRLKDELGPAPPSRASRHGRMSSTVSHSHPASERNAAASSSSSKTFVELELLKQENAELRREVSAQTSMLTSRNREKERLYQEIEDLKLGQRRSDGRSVAGDSILERSASRAADRAASRVSEGTRVSQMSDAERESYEVRTGELRDQVSALKLDNQNLRAQLDECMAELDTIDRVYQDDLDRMEEELQAVQMEREQALRVADEREADLQDLKAEAQGEIDSLNDDLDDKTDLCQRLEVELKNQDENLKALQSELRSASEGILRLEQDAQNNLQKYKTVRNELDDANRELENMEKNLFEANSKVQRLTVQQESSQNEIAFLREEQDGDKIRIGDLESALKTTETSLQSERDRAKELEHRLAEERHQREVVDSKEKQQVQRIVNELNREASAAKDEVRRLKKSLSAREIEASTWKDRLHELEDSIRERLGDMSGKRSSLLSSITQLQKELEATALELESTRSKLDEKEALLRNRDALLESHALETRKLSDLLERERQAHRADKHSFEQSLKSHHQASRTIVQSNSRITELENARAQDRKRYANLEQQYKDQLTERNQAFLNIWKRLSAICGPDWAHSNSLINGNLPSQEVIGNMLFWPGFSKNLMLAVRTVEGIINGCRTRIKAVERDLTKEYQSLEQNLNTRMKKLERLEEAIVQLRVNRRPPGSNPNSPELSKLRGENRLLKAELNLLSSHPRARASAPSASSAHSRSDQASRASSAIPRPSGFSPAPTTSTAPTTKPSSDAGAVATQAPFYPPSHHLQARGEASQEKWIQRLRELERRLKAEREARLLDRSGARKRLEERNAENEELRAELERERMKSRNPPPSGGTGGGAEGRQRRRRDQHSSDQRHGSEGSRRRDGHTGDGERESDGSHGTSNSGQVVVIEHRGYRDQSDSYDGEDDYDEGTGTGTDDGGGLTVEVEV